MTTTGRLAGGSTKVGNIMATQQKEHWCPNGKHKFNCSSTDCSQPYEQNCEAHPEPKK